MCDYSLERVASRSAVVGDKIVSSGFRGTSSRGFASMDQRETAVCLLPGTEVAFDERVRYPGRFLPCKTAYKVARFCQVDMDKPNAYHDALMFPDGTVVMVNYLREGQVARVIQLPVAVELAKPKSAGNQVPQFLVKQPHAAELPIKGDAPAMEGWHAPTRVHELA